MKLSLTFASFAATPRNCQSCVDATCYALVEGFAKELEAIFSSLIQFIRSHRALSHKTCQRCRGISIFLVLLLADLKDDFDSFDH